MNSTAHKRKLQKNRAAPKQPRAPIHDLAWALFAAHALAAQIAKGHNSFNAARDAAAYADEMFFRFQEIEEPLFSSRIKSSKTRPRPCARRKS